MKLKLDWLFKAIPPLALTVGSVGGLWYGFVQRKPVSVSDLVVTPYPVRPDSSFVISGQFKDRTGQGAFVPQGYYYVYLKIPPKNPGEIETRMLQASGTLGTLPDGRFSKLISSEGFDAGKYALVVNDGIPDDLPHVIFTIFQSILNPQEEPPPSDGGNTDDGEDDGQGEDINATVPIPFTTGPNAANPDQPYAVSGYTDDEWIALTSSV